MTSISSPVPRLLVSVRDAREAVFAMQGGADVIDFKNPDRGPLGRADVDVMEGAIAAIQSQNGDRCLADGRAFRDGCVAERMTLSAAVGEVIEYDGLSGSPLPSAISFLKLGLSGLGQSSNWVQEWLRVRNDVESRAAAHVRWVAVAYADAGAAAAPPVADVVQAAGETSCAGVLIDTFDKSGGRLLDCADAASLLELARLTRDQQMFFAVAGRLQVSDFAALCNVGPDIIAIRSAACNGENRNASIAAAKVAAARAAIQRAFAPQETVRSI